MQVYSQPELALSTGFQYQSSLIDHTLRLIKYLECDFNQCFCYSSVKIII